MILAITNMQSFRCVLPETVVFFFYHGCIVKLTMVQVAEGLAYYRKHRKPTEASTNNTNAQNVPKKPCEHNNYNDDKQNMDENDDKMDHEDKQKGTNKQKAAQDSQHDARTNHSEKETITYVTTVIIWCYLANSCCYPIYLHFLFNGFCSTKADPSLPSGPVKLSKDTEFLCHAEKMQE